MVTCWWENIFKFINKKDIPWVNLIWGSYYQHRLPPGQNVERSFRWRDCLTYYLSSQTLSHVKWTVEALLYSKEINGKHPSSWNKASPILFSIAWAVYCIAHCLVGSLSIFVPPFHFYRIDTSGPVNHGSCFCHGAWHLDMAPNIIWLLCLLYVHKHVRNPWWYPCINVDWQTYYPKKHKISSDFCCMRLNTREMV